MARPSGDTGVDILPPPASLGIVTLLRQLTDSKSTNSGAATTAAAATGIAELAAASVRIELKDRLGWLTPTAARGDGEDGDDADGKDAAVDGSLDIPALVRQLSAEARALRAADAEDSNRNPAAGGVDGTDAFVLRKTSHHSIDRHRLNQLPNAVRLLQRRTAADATARSHLTRVGRRVDAPVSAAWQPPRRQALISARVLAADAKAQAQAAYEAQQNAMRDAKRRGVAFVWPPPPQGVEPGQEEARATEIAELKRLELRARKGQRNKNKSAEKPDGGGRASGDDSDPESKAEAAVALDAAVKRMAETADAAAAVANRRKLTAARQSYDQWRKEAELIRSTPPDRMPPCKNDKKLTAKEAAARRRPFERNADAHARRLREAEDATAVKKAEIVARSSIVDLQRPPLFVPPAVQLAHAQPSRSSSHRNRNGYTLASRHARKARRAQQRSLLAKVDVFGASDLPVASGALMSGVGDEPDPLRPPPSLGIVKLLRQLSDPNSTNTAAASTNTANPSNTASVRNELDDRLGWLFVRTADPDDSGADGTGDDDLDIPALVRQLSAEARASRATHSTHTKATTSTAADDASDTPALCAGARIVSALELLSDDGNPAAGGVDGTDAFVLRKTSHHSKDRHRVNQLPNDFRLHRRVLHNPMGMTASPTMRERFHHTRAFGEYTRVPTPVAWQSPQRRAAILERKRAVKAAEKQEYEKKTKARALRDAQRRGVKLVWPPPPYVDPKPAESRAKAEAEAKRVRLQSQKGQKNKKKPTEKPAQPIRTRTAGTSDGDAAFDTATDAKTVATTERAANSDSDPESKAEAAVAAEADRRRIEATRASYETWRAEAERLRSTPVRGEAKGGEKKLSPPEVVARRAAYERAVAEHAKQLAKAERIARAEVDELFRIDPQQKPFVSAAVQLARFTSSRSKSGYVNANRYRHKAQRAHTRSALAKGDVFGASDMPKLKQRIGGL